MKTFRKFTSAIPLAERTTVLFNANGFANTVDEKRAMAARAKTARGAAARRLYAAWPGEYDTHVFTVTPDEVIGALTPKPAIKVGDLVKLVKPYGGSTAPAVGSIGVVRQVRPDMGRLAVSVEWADYARGHDNGYGISGKTSGWKVGFEHIERA